MANPMPSREARQVVRAAAEKAGYKRFWLKEENGEDGWTIVFAVDSRKRPLRRCTVRERYRCCGAPTHC